MLISNQHEHTPNFLSYILLQSAHRTRKASSSSAGREACHYQISNDTSSGGCPSFSLRSAAIWFCTPWWAFLHLFFDANRVADSMVGTRSQSRITSVDVVHGGRRWEEEPTEAMHLSRGIIRVWRRTETDGGPVESLEEEQPPSSSGHFLINIPGGQVQDSDGSRSIYIITWAPCN